MTADDEAAGSRPAPSGDDEALDVLLAALAAAPTTAPWSWLGKRVGRYTVEGPLGRGGMGEVYRAFDPELRRDVALRVLQVDAGSSLLDEARAAAQLTSPHIAPIYDVLTDDGQTVVAMELVDGPSLAALLQTRRLSEAEVVRIARGVAEALAVAHDAGLVHRDIKPGNVLLRADGHPLLVDFGLAAAHGDDESAAGGTPRYVAPEQAAGAAPAPTADAFAFGVTNAGHARAGRDQAIGHREAPGALYPA